jgi:hypothetical protein
MLEVTLTNEQKVIATLSPKTATGKPAQVDGVPTWSVVAGNGTVTPSGDGLSCECVPADAPAIGDVDFQVEADADLGSGVVPLTDLLRAHVSGAQAENLGLTADVVSK